ncbi:ABC transporter permease [Burkholderia sp. AU28942]|uniref:ABC transporter permease n=1 Tax=Burkholderia TaxID=32008 RepID=UPI000B0BF2A3|nr:MULTISPECIES: ABC transporter permease [Burkholderia]MCA8312403.1 ABC transporter permease [Burkholderia sp. AU28942]
MNYASIAQNAPNHFSTSNFSSELSELNILSAEELAEISGAWNWGGMLLSGLQGSVLTGLTTAAGAAATGQPIGIAGISGMVSGGLAGAVQGGLNHPR